MCTWIVCDVVTQRHTHSYDSSPFSSHQHTLVYTLLYIKQAATKLAELALLHPDRRLAEAAASGLIAELPQEAQYFDRYMSARVMCVYVPVCGRGRVDDGCPPWIGHLTKSTN